MTPRHWTFDTAGLRVFTHPNGYVAFYTPFVPEESIECLNPCDLHQWA
jgi:hypothetical protein